jgi:alkyldihydroxyacetonephosphate synthase
VTARPPLPAHLGAAAARQPTRFQSETAIDEKMIASLAQVCSHVTVDDEARVAAGRDWWPLSVTWAIDGTVPSVPAVVARPTDSQQVAGVLALCNQARVPVTVVAGASGVCGGSIPLFGGVSLDATGLDGVVDVDDSSLLVDVRAGMFGEPFETTLRSRHGLTLGHWPQSIALSTVGGWVACRGAGQYSTRYGKIEDMVVGLEAVLADGRTIRTGGTAPRAATGPDLSQLFVGSEGTLGVITEVRLRVRPGAADERRSCFGFPDFTSGLDACRRILRRGATPAVLRLYDHAETARNFDISDSCALIVVDEGDPTLIQAVADVVGQECGSAVPLDPALADRWLEHRNQIPPLESLARAGIVADTVEISASWSALPGIYRTALEGLNSLEATIASSAHQSHAYTDGGCLYFTFAGRPPADQAEHYYRHAFDIVMSATTAAGGALSHHHGIGLNRARYMRDYLGPAFDVLAQVKAALDPNGILNPGKLGLPSPFGSVWED